MSARIGTLEKELARDDDGVTLEITRGPGPSGRFYLEMSAGSEASDRIELFLDPARALNIATSLARWSAETTIHSSVHDPETCRVCQRKARGEAG